MAELSWKIKIRKSGANGDLAEMLNAAEMTGSKSTEEILGEDRCLDANRERWREARREVYSVLARYTSYEAVTIVQSVTELDGVGTWARLHANYSRRTLERMLKVQRECMYPKPAKDVDQVRLPTMQWVDNWKGMMSELTRDAKIPDLWRMSALLETCPKDVMEQMLMRLYEIGENCENLKAKVIYCTTNKAEQARGGQRETVVPMELDHVSGGELYDEDWEDVDEVRGDKRCYNYGMMGRLARDCRMNGKGEGEGREGGKGYAKGESKTVNGARKKGSGKSGGFKGEQKGWGYQGQCWTCGKIGDKSSECRWEIDNVDEDDADSPESEKDDEVGGVWVVGSAEELEDEELICECRERREVGEGIGRSMRALGTSS